MAPSGRNSELLSCDLADDADFIIQTHGSCGHRENAHVYARFQQQLKASSANKETPCVSHSMLRGGKEEARTRALLFPAFKKTPN